MKMNVDGLGLNNTLDAQSNYYDLQSLDALRQKAHSDDKKEALAQAAQQFEAIFMRMMLKSMRDAQDAIADEDSPFNSSTMKFYRDMNDQQLATQLAQNGNMGLAEVVLRQFGGDENYKNADLLNSDRRFSPHLAMPMDMNAIQRVKSTGKETDSPFNTKSLDAHFESQGLSSTQTPKTFESKEAFVAYLMPHAEKAAKPLGIAPQALVAQAALETNWGKQVIQHGQQSSHNLFGIKADKRWDGERSQVTTLEFVDGVPERQMASFRAYPSFEDSLKDYVNFVSTSPRYQGAVANANNTRTYFEQLQQGGYATDPEYANKIMRVLDSDVFHTGTLSSKGAK